MYVASGKKPGMNERVCSQYQTQSSLASLQSASMNTHISFIYNSQKLLISFRKQNLCSAKRVVNNASNASVVKCFSLDSTLQSVMLHSLTHTHTHTHTHTQHTHIYTHTHSLTETTIYATNKQWKHASQLTKSKRKPHKRNKKNSSNFHRKIIPEKATHMSQFSGHVDFSIHRTLVLKTSTQSFHFSLDPTATSVSYTHLTLPTSDLV